MRTAFAAISKGALDVIEKPDISPENVQTLIRKIRYLAKVDVSAHLQVMGNLDKAKTESGVAIQNGSLNLQGMFVILLGPAVFSIVKALG